MSNDASVRYIGSILRQTVQSHYAGNGSEFGYRVARRALFEVASCIADNHSVEDAVEVCYRVGDRIAAVALAGAGATIFPGEELLPGPRAALAAVEAAAPEPEPSGLPEYTVQFSGGTMVVTGDLVDGRDQLRSALDSVEAMIAELHPPAPPPPEPRLRRALRWAGGLVTWRELVIWTLGFAMGGGFGR